MLTHEYCFNQEIVIYKNVSEIIAAENIGLNKIDTY